MTWRARALSISPYVEPSFLEESELVSYDVEHWSTIHQSLTPGMYWYFFTEIFDNFRVFFLFVFHAFAPFLLLPVLIRLGATRQGPDCLLIVYPTPSPPSSSCRCSFASVPRGRPGGRSLIPSPFATYVSGDKRLNVGLENKAYASGPLL